nr:FxDxF family PEP-CTERM protein [Aquabacterium olei]
MKLKSLVAAAAFIAAGASAQAAALSFSPVGGGLKADLSGIGDTSFTFTLSSDYLFSSSVAGVQITIPGLFDTGAPISSVSLNGTAFSLASSSTASGPVISTTYTYSLLNYPLSAGSYTLDVKATGAFGGVATLAPVPEPESLALAVAGLGVAGFVARRRKSA